MLTASRDDIMWSTAYVKYWIDCPYCGNVIDLDEGDPSGEEIDCDDCKEKFVAS